MKAFSRTDTSLRSFVLAAIVTTLTMHHAVAASLQDTPFWRDSVGWWSSDNTYMDGKLHQKIPAYNSIVHVEIQGARVVQTTHRFYPPGDSTGYYSKGQVQNDKGIELVSIMTMEVIDDSGTLTTVSTTPAAAEQPGDMTTTPLSPTLALQQKREPASGLVSYHTVITMPTPDRRYTSMFGIRTGLENEEVEAGDLRGLALYYSRRITAADVDALRLHFREVHSVGAVVSGDANGNTVVDVLN